MARPLTCGPRDVTFHTSSSEIATGSINKNWKRVMSDTEKGYEVRKALAGLPSSCVSRPEGRLSVPEGSPALRMADQGRTCHMLKWSLCSAFIASISSLPTLLISSPLSYLCLDCFLGYELCITLLSSLSKVLR